MDLLRLNINLFGGNYSTFGKVLQVCILGRLRSSFLPSLSFSLSSNYMYSFWYFARLNYCPTSSLIIFLGKTFGSFPKSSSSFLLLSHTLLLVLLSFFYFFICFFFFFLNLLVLREFLFSISLLKWTLGWKTPPCRPKDFPSFMPGIEVNIGSMLAELNCFGQEQN